MVQIYTRIILIISYLIGNKFTELKNESNEFNFVKNLLIDQ